MEGAAEGAKVASMLSSAKSSKTTSKSSPAPKDFDSAVSLQSGDAANPTPYWDIGVDGTSQFVQVVDTGFDDASCLLRDGPKEGLSGNQSDTLQVMNGKLGWPAQRRGVQLRSTSAVALLTSIQSGVFFSSYMFPQTSLGALLGVANRLRRVFFCTTNDRLQSPQDHFLHGSQPFHRLLPRL